jgi:tRNA (Thr-GGU) A37 N-methylase
MTIMETTLQLQPIGKVVHENGMFVIQIDEAFRPALTNLNGFSHLQIVWWGNQSDSPEMRQQTMVEKPYKKGPDKLGLFATRSPVRPNPVLITTIEAINVDCKKGRISTWYIDACPGTPILDIKPYHLSERVHNCHVPDWCSHWPQWYEESATFDWPNEFNF